MWLALRPERRSISPRRLAAPGALTRASQSRPPAPRRRRRPCAWDSAESTWEAGGGGLGRDAMRARPCPSRLRARAAARRHPPRALGGGMRCRRLASRRDAVPPPWPAQRARCPPAQPRRLGPAASALPPCPLRLSVSGFGAARREATQDHGKIPYLFMASAAPDAMPRRRRLGPRAGGLSCSNPAASTHTHTHARTHTHSSLASVAQAGAGWLTRRIAHRGRCSGRRVFPGPPDCRSGRRAASRTALAPGQEPLGAEGATAAVVPSQS